MRRECTDGDESDTREREGGGKRKREQKPGKGKALPSRCATAMVGILEDIWKNDTTLRETGRGSSS